MTVKGNEEIYQRSPSEKRFTIFMGFSFSFFRIFCYFFLLLHDVSSTHLSKRTLPKILVLFDNQDQDSKPEEKVLCNFPCFRIETVLLNPSAFQLGKKFMKEIFVVFSGSLGLLLGKERLQEQERH